MTDRKFILILPHRPASPRRGRKRSTNLRAVVDDIFSVLQNGCFWSNLPKDFSPKSRVYWYYRGFSEDGTWSCIHDALYIDCRDLKGREEQPSAAIMDSQSVKTGPNGDETVGYDAGKKIKGRKRHILTDTLGLLLKADVHSAGIQDRNGAVRLFDKLMAPSPFLQVIIGDGGYAGPKFRKAAPRSLDIVRRSDHAKGFRVISKRWIVERTLAWITLNRGFTRDFERSAETAAAYIQIPMIKVISRRLARHGYP